MKHMLHVAVLPPDVGLALGDLAGRRKSTGDAIMPLAAIVWGPTIGKWGLAAELTRRARRIGHLALVNC